MIRGTEIHIADSLGVPGVSGRQWRYPFREQSGQVESRVLSKRSVQRIIHDAFIGIRTSLLLKREGNHHGIC